MCLKNTYISKYVVKLSSVYDYYTLELQPKTKILIKSKNLFCTYFRVIMVETKFLRPLSFLDTYHQGN